MRRVVTGPAYAVEELPVDVPQVPVPPSAGGVVNGRQTSRQTTDDRRQFGNSVSATVSATRASRAVDGRQSTVDGFGPGTHLAKAGGARRSTPMTFARRLLIGEGGPRGER